MKYLFSLFFMATTLLFACKNKKDKTSGTAINTETTAPAPKGNDTAAIRAVIMDFYNWYNNNYKKLMRYELYSSIKKKNAAPYKFNWEEAARYQAYIRDSVPWLGDEFLANQKLMFARADSAFRVNTKDDVPLYFDYDWYTNSQEDPGYLLTGLKRSDKWIFTIKGDDATVEIGAPEDKDYLAGSLLLFVGLKREKGVWAISRIGND